MTESIATLLIIITPMLAGAVFGTLAHMINSRRTHLPSAERIEPTLTWNGPYPSVPLENNRIEPTL